MIYRDILEKELNKLELDRKGYTVKRIKGKIYLYRQERNGDKVVTKCEGQIQEEDILGSAITRIRLVK